MDEKAKTKKPWHKPAIIVLVRRKPEEGVLDLCKQQAVYELGPFEDPCDYFGPCNDLAPS